MRYATPFAIALALTPVAAVAQTCGLDLEARFVEGAPVDRFIITNGEASDIALSGVTFDLTPSKGRLIFDTASGGQGVEVFQPFRSDAASVTVADGAEGLRIPLNGLKSQGQMSFSIDVDDRLTSSELGQIRVSGSEMQGAVVQFTVGGDVFTATFDAQNTAQVAAKCGDNT